MLSDGADAETAPLFLRVSLARVTVKAVLFMAGAQIRHAAVHASLSAAIAAVATAA
jgi:hypothetical protein